MTVSESLVRALVQEYAKSGGWGQAGANRALDLAVEYFAHAETPSRVAQVSEGDALGNGYLWATSRQVVYIGVRSSQKETAVVRKFEYEDIYSIEFHDRFFTDNQIVITLDNGGFLSSREKVKFNAMGGDKKKDQAFVAYVQRKVDPGEAFASEADPAGRGSGSVVDELERLTELRESGAITETEFRAVKQKLLGE